MLPVRVVREIYDTNNLVFPKTNKTLLWAKKNTKP